MALCETIQFPFGSKPETGLRTRAVARRCGAKGAGVHGTRYATRPIINSKSSLLNSNAGRRFDTDTGLYYYRARYYNPYIGRFLQADPIGYGDGMNMYAYCGNNATNLTDSSGMKAEPGFSFFKAGGCLVFTAYGTSHSFKDGINGWIDWAMNGGPYGTQETGELHVFSEGWEEGEVGWQLAAAGGEGEDRRWWFWRIKALTLLSGRFEQLVKKLERKISEGWDLELRTTRRNFYDSNVVQWNPVSTQIYGGTTPNWYKVHPLAMLAHELAHAYDDADGGFDGRRGREHIHAEKYAMKYENMIRRELWEKDPGCDNLYPRPGYLRHHRDVRPDVTEAWKNYRWRDLKY